MHSKQLNRREFMILLYGVTITGLEALGATIKE
jgi:hypothetical protein